MFAEFETNLRKERQLEEIAAAKARGGLQGPQAVDRRGGWLRPVWMVPECASVYRLLQN